MTLWINGDWVTGQGALRVKRNPVSGEVLWQGNDAEAMMPMPLRSGRLVGLPVRRFRAGLGSHLAIVR